jgi:hypothetical protein
MWINVAMITILLAVSRRKSLNIVYQSSSWVPAFFKCPATKGYLPIVTPEHSSAWCRDSITTVNATTLNFSILYGNVGKCSFQPSCSVPPNWRPSSPLLSYLAQNFATDTGSQFLISNCVHPASWIMSPSSFTMYRLVPHYLRTDGMERTDSVDKYILKQLLHLTVAVAGVATTNGTALPPFPTSIWFWQP